MPATTKYSVSFTTLFTEEQGQKLTDVANKRGIPKTAALRQMVDAAYDHEFSRKPRCASGDPCRCPHAHVYGPAA